MNNKKLIFKKGKVTGITEEIIRQRAPVNLAIQNDLIIDGNYTYTNPIYAKNLTIKSTCVFSTTQLIPVVIWAETITIETGAQINLDGLGWFGGRAGDISDLFRQQADIQFSQWLSWIQSADYQGWVTNDFRPALGYVPGSWQAAFTNSSGSYGMYDRRGGDAPALNKPGVNKTMAGLAGANSTLASGWGAGASGVLGAGGGGGSDGASGFGGGSGAGGGGGSASNGSYQSPSGGHGAQADPIVNLELFKNWQIGDIPLFGGGGGFGYSTTIGGNGGGSIQLYAALSISIAAGAVISCKGTNGTANGTYHRAGGGGGGSILIATPYVKFVKENLDVSGGLGASGNYAGGNGGNGLILLNTNSEINLSEMKLSKVYKNRLISKKRNIINTAYVPHISSGRAEISNATGIYNSTGAIIHDPQTGNSTSTIRIGGFDTNVPVSEIKFNAYDMDRSSYHPTYAYLRIRFINGTERTVNFMNFAQATQGQSSAKTFVYQYMWVQPVEWIEFQVQFNNRFFISDLEVSSPVVENKILPLTLLKRSSETTLNIEKSGAKFPGTLCFLFPNLVIEKTDVIFSETRFHDYTKRHYLYGAEKELSGDKRVGRGVFVSVSETNINSAVVLKTGDDPSYIRANYNGAGRWVWDVNFDGFNRFWRIIDHAGAYYLDYDHDVNGKIYPHGITSEVLDSAQGFAIGSNNIDNNAGTLNQNFKGILKRLTVGSLIDGKLYEKQNLKLDVRPVWDGEVLKLYDFVSETFLTPTGTGELTPGYLVVPIT